MAQLLNSYRVLDLSDEKGSYAGEILAGFGADVIKIEPPSGSPARNIGPFYHDIPDPEKSLRWFAYNRNKRGMTLNIETSDGQEIFKRLIKNAHFVIETYPPGYMESVGLAYDSLSQINPAIIVCSITPFGHTGPYKNYKSSDLVAWATGGMLYVCGDPDRPPVRTNSDLAYGEAGLQSAVAMMVAHHYRRQTGEGQHIDVSLQECVTVLLWYIQPEWEFNKVVIRRVGQNLPTSAPGISSRIIFGCKDGAVSWQMATAYFGRWTRPLVEWMAEEGMASDELKAVQWEKIDYVQLATQTISRWLNEFAKFCLTKTKAELLEEGYKRGVMLLYPSNTMKDCVEDEQLLARNFWVEAEHPELGDRILYPGAPLLLNEAQWSMSRRAPLIGEHNEEIYTSELGFSREELVLLKEHNVI